MRVALARLLLSPAGGSGGQVWGAPTREGCIVLASVGLSV